MDLLSQNLVCMNFAVCGLILTNHKDVVSIFFTSAAQAAAVKRGRNAALEFKLSHFSSYFPKNRLRYVNTFSICSDCVSKFNLKVFGFTLNASRLTLLHGTCMALA